MVLPTPKLLLPKLFRLLVLLATPNVLFPKLFRLLGLPTPRVLVVFCGWVAPVGSNVGPGEPVVVGPLGPF